MIPSQSEREELQREISRAGRRRDGAALVGTREHFESAGGSAPGGGVCRNLGWEVDAGRVVCANKVGTDWRVGVTLCTRVESVEVSVEERGELAWTESELGPRVRRAVHPVSTR